MHQFVDDYYLHVKLPLCILLFHSNLYQRSIFACKSHIQQVTQSGTVFEFCSSSSQCFQCRPAACAAGYVYGATVVSPCLVATAAVLTLANALPHCRVG